MLFPELCVKLLSATFDGGHVSSDGGCVLLAEVDRRGRYLERFAQCFRDLRDPERVEHPLVVMLRQRVLAMAQGYEDLNDHDRLCTDPLLASVCGADDPLGQDRVRAQDRGKALAGKSTLNRLELTPASATAAARYQKIVADAQAVEDLFLDLWIDSLSADAREVILDLDRTDDPLYGQQEGRFFHGYYDEYCYTPLYIFDGDWPVVAALHTAESDHFEEVLRVVARIVERVRVRYPELRIVVRGDSGFARDELMSWCEAHGVIYVLGLARNRVLERMLRGSLRLAKSLRDFNGSAVERVFKDLRYRARSWGRKLRRVVGKAEWSAEGPNPRFVITNEPMEAWPTQPLYEVRYCGRGNMENRIKEQKLDLFAGRTSTAVLTANQLRLWFSTLAYVLVTVLRRVGLAGTALAHATAGTLRTRLLKIGAVVRVTARRVWVHLSSAYPLQELFRTAAGRLVAGPSG